MSLRNVIAARVSSMPVITAFLRPAAGCSPTVERLFAFCRQHLAPYNTPKHWVFMNDFPLTPSGKVQRHILREKFIVQQPAAP